MRSLGCKSWNCMSENVVITGLIRFLERKVHHTWRREEFSASCDEPSVKEAKPLTELSKFPLTEFQNLHIADLLNLSVARDQNQTNIIRAVKQWLRTHKN